MKLNGISKIDNMAGDYIVLIDYGIEGIRVGAQFTNLEGALGFCITDARGNGTAVVKLVNIEELDLSRL